MLCRFAQNRLAETWVIATHERLGDWEEQNHILFYHYPILVWRPKKETSTSSLVTSPNTANVVVIHHDNTLEPRGTVADITKLLAIPMSMSP